FWDFGDGKQAQGENVGHAFMVDGEFNVRLGLTLKSEESGDVIMRAVTKKVIVFKSGQERDAYVAGKPEVRKDLTDIRKFENVIVKGHYSAELDFRKEAVFQVEILSSPERRPLNNSFFRNVPSKYVVKEIYNPESNTYSYIIDEQMNLMESYPAYYEMIASGYSDARVRIFVLTDPAEKELLILKKNYGILTDTYFDMNNRLVTNAYLMLDQVVTLMNKYPGINLEIGVHTDNQGSTNALRSLSQTRAQVIVNYLINRGIAADRLTARGHGGVRPVASNTDWLDRRLNRRVDFKIID
ncbi:MAG: OmpA family protein, partial [Bacteroidales bacterium]|nr:OmpA family protein [Bacteroidales bacterium]